MRRYLVVANRTLAGRQLLECVRHFRESGSCWFYVVVPATVDASASLSEDAEARARHRLAGALARFRAEGASALGEVGHADPVRAVRDVLERQSFDEVIVSTLPPGESSWSGLPEALARVTGLPVAHVAADGEPLSVQSAAGG